MALELAPLTSATHKGRRPYQEDRMFSMTMVEGLCFGVFDGHGGDKCSNTVAELFPRLFGDVMMESGKNVSDAFLETFQKLDVATAGMYEGTTASVAFVPWEGDRVWTATLGDSPIIVRRADGSVWEAPEHNVRTNKDEARAAIGRGGYVSGGYLYVGEREFYSDNGIGLQMGRALGDRELAKVLNRVPDVSMQVLGTDSFVLVATDGALDPGHKDQVKASKKVLNIIQTGGTAQSIVNYAIAVPTGDNVTAMLLRVILKQEG